MGPISELPDSEILAQLSTGQLKPYQLEEHLGPVRAVTLRKEHLLSSCSPETRNSVPCEGFLDYETAARSCCENVIGFVPVPLGLAGPLVVNGAEYRIPIATTEGALVASLSRGCKAVKESDGIQSICTYFGMTRAPLLKFISAKSASEGVTWISNNLETLKAEFESTSSYAKLKSITPKQAGKLLFLRVVATTGEAMGMNMIGKGCEQMLKFLKTVDCFNEMMVLSLSGNYCVDKKASAMNWINNRGYSVTCDVTLRHDVIRSVLKTTAGALDELNTSKNYIGSALAGSIGGNNAHAANIVTGIYLATGQDVAQSGTSAMSLVTMEPVGEGDLYVSVTMPCLELGTVGGGTVLAAQRNNIKLISSDSDVSSSTLAQVVCGAVLCGEISLLAALTSGDLIKSHMKLNR